VRRGQTMGFAWAACRSARGSCGAGEGQYDAWEWFGKVLAMVERWVEWREGSQSAMREVREGGEVEWKVNLLRLLF
jgi:hypothetical protein